MIDDIQNNALYGIGIGLGIATLPAVTTGLITCSKIILVNIIAELAVRLLTANTMTLRGGIHGISFVQVPLLWKFSAISAIAGCGLMALSGTVLLGSIIYERVIDPKKTNSY